ncbi:MAG: hypothetical protein ABI182_04725 [Candidatus Baltobacteraceae bacterium]
MRTRRRKRVLEFAVVLSAILHLIVGPLLVRWGWLRIPEAKLVPPKFIITTSSSLHLEKQTHARAAAAMHPDIVPPAPQPKQLLPRPRKESPAHRDLARITPKALTPEPPRAVHHASSVISGEDLAQQEQQFAKTIAQARAANNPLSVPPSLATPASAHLSRVDFEGQNGSFQGGHGLLTPIQHWTDGSNHCSRVHYELEYYSGGSEDGNVPWPICYPGNRDPFQLPPHQMALPSPMPDYVLPPDAQLEPYLKKYFPNRFPDAGPP